VLTFILCKLIEHLIGFLLYAYVFKFTRISNTVDDFVMECIRFCRVSITSHLVLRVEAYSEQPFITNYTEQSPF
jgi:hypothetical protein